MCADALIQRTFRDDVHALAVNIQQLSGVVYDGYITPVSSIIKIFNTLDGDIGKIDIGTNWGAIVSMMSTVKSSFSALNKSIYATHHELSPIISLFENAIIIDSATGNIQGISKRCVFMVNIFNKIGWDLHGINSIAGFLFLGRDARHVMDSIIAKLIGMSVDCRVDTGRSLSVEWKAINKLADLLSSVIAKRGFNSFCQNEFLCSSTCHYHIIIKLVSKLLPIYLSNIENRSYTHRFEDK